MRVRLGNGATIDIGESVFIWYLTPTILDARNVPIADTGCTVMLYYLVQVLAESTIARLADGKIGYVPMLVGIVLLIGAVLMILTESGRGLHRKAAMEH